MDPTNLVQYASKELKLAGLLGNSTQKENEFGCRVLSIMAKLREYKYDLPTTFKLLNVLARVARFMPLTPLTGEEGEWHRVGSVPDLPYVGITHQNSRFFNVYKDNQGRIFQSDGYRVTRPDGKQYFAIKEIQFPYLPCWTEISEADYRNLKASIKTEDKEVKLEPEVMVVANS